MKTSGRTTVRIAISGRDLIILKSSTFMLANWRFRNPEVLALLVEYDPSHLISDRIFEDLKSLLESASLWYGPPGGWTQDFVDARARVQGTVEWSTAEIDDLILALRVCHAEFKDEHGWVDFMVASPGDLRRYDVQPQDLLSLMTRLETHLRR